MNNRLRPLMIVVSLTMSDARHALAADGGSGSQIDEVDVTSRKQSALAAEAISISSTPDAEPSVGGETSVVIGLGALVAPAYDGSKTTKTSPFPYVDIHGLFHDRVFLSDVRGIGVNVWEQGGFRAGASINYGGGRTSSDSPRLRGLPDISAALSAAGYLTYSLKPLAFELKVQREFGSLPSTEVGLGLSYALAVTPRWHLSVGADLKWTDAKFNQKYFGVTATDASRAVAQGNLLSAYVPGSGLSSVSIVATSIYALSAHWGIATRLGFNDLMGSAAKDSPLTERNTGASVALGALYKF